MIRDLFDADELLELGVTYSGNIVIKVAETDYSLYKMFIFTIGLEGQGPLCQYRKDAALEMDDTALRWMFNDAITEIYKMFVQEFTVGNIKMVSKYTSSSNPLYH